MIKHYCIHLRNSDEIVAAGNAAECAKVLNMTVKDFLTMVKENLKGKHRKYIINILDFDDEEEG